MKTILILLFILITLKALAPGNGFICLGKIEAENALEGLISAIVMVESSGRNTAVNYYEMAVGAFQIRECRIAEYNRLTGNHYLLEDCYDYEIAKEVFTFYAYRIGIYKIEQIARSWNGGANAKRKWTDKYWKLVNEKLNINL